MTHLETDLDNRMPRFVGGPPDPGAILAQKHVTVVGGGSVGLAAICHLARAGVGALTIVDRGKLKAASVKTHPIEPSAVGEWKAEYAGQVARAIHPEIHVETHSAAFQDLPIAFLDCDAVVLAVDNLGTEVDVTTRCINQGLLHLHCAVHGGTMVATVRTLTGGEHGEGPCIACNYNAAEWQQIALEPRYSCDGVGEVRSLAPTQSLSSLCSLAAELGVHKLLRHLVGFGVPLSDGVLEYRGHTDELVNTAVRRNPDCPVDHVRWAQAERSEAESLAEVLGRVALGRDATVEVDGRVFAERAACGCGATPTVGRFVDSAEALGGCPRCGKELQHSPFHERRAVPAAELGTAALTGSSASLGVPAGSAIVVRDRAELATLVRAKARNSTGGMV